MSDPTLTRLITELHAIAPPEKAFASILLVSTMPGVGTIVEWVTGRVSGP